MKIESAFFLVQHCPVRDDDSVVSNYQKLLFAADDLPEPDAVASRSADSPEPAKRNYPLCRRLTKPGDELSRSTTCDPITNL